ncbi:MAG: ABC transporter ATP-binding protein [Proteobacteria bacterium]|nr:ABC transporter ATP-binding protein [Pseudomonadota bacterium]MDA1072108.1 ABC transporter ATP-binding protein [Pseudomonadota bacterium]
MSVSPAGAAPPLLACRNITRRFGALVAVNDLSFELNPGEILGIGGPNGAGKTTLFDVISGFVPTDEGAVLHRGEDISRMQPHQVCHHGLGRTFQLNAAFATLTVYENVLAAAHFGQPRSILTSLTFHREAIEATWEALEFVGLKDRHDLVVGSLPVVDRKRVMIASALATRPDCLLMDEPVGGLNPKEIEEMLGLVRQIRDAGTAIILIEHVMRFLVSLSDRVLIMHHGERLFLGKTAEMSRDEKVAEVYLGKKAAQRIRDFVAAGDAA